MAVAVGLRPHHDTVLRLVPSRGQRDGRLVPVIVELAKVPPMPTIATAARVTASHYWQADHVDAVNDQLVPTEFHRSRDPALYVVEPSGHDRVGAV